jgi:hypothetical protein
MNQSQNAPYWATLPQHEIADEILDRVDKFYEYLSLSGRLDFYRRSWSYYYRGRVTGAQINPAGEQGELTTLAVNHYRNLLVHLETMTTQQKAAFEPKATNSDVKSQSQVILAAALLDYYMREKKLNRNIKQAVKDALIFAEGFLRAEWDPTSGDTYGTTPTGAPVYQGDMKYTNYTPLDVIRDFTKTSPNQDDWYVLRDFVNKHTLAAKFPALANEILTDSVDMLEVYRTTTLNALALEESDNVLQYTLIHKPTPALPQGRFTTCLDNGTVMLDGPIPYKEAHVYRIAPDEESGTIFGYTVGADLLPMQEGIDILYSTALTNQATFGVQNILTPKGQDLSTSQISGGLNIVEYDPKVGEPKALNLTSTPPEVFNFMNMIEKLMETISGVNSVARGNPEASLKSGAALALVQSMAIQFSMNLQQSYAQLVEDVGTGTIKILQDFAAVPRVAAIAGKSNRPLMKEFTGEDLNAINRVMVDMGNPMTATIAGKTNLAEQMMNFNLIDNPDQYIQVVTTGRLEPVIQGKQSELLLIKSENEMLSEGKPQRALVTDQHAQHIMEHKTVMASPEVRSNPNDPIVTAALDHIQQHINFLQTANPALLALIHQQSIGAPPQPQGPQGPQGQGGGTPQMLNATPPVMQQAAEVQGPRMPSPPRGTDPQSAAIINAQK